MILSQDILVWLARVGVALPLRSEVPLLDAVGSCRRSFASQLWNDFSKAWVGLSVITVRCGSGSKAAQLQSVTSAPTSVEMKRHAMVEMAMLLVTALRSRALGPHDHNACKHVDDYTTRTMLDVLQRALTAPG